MHAWGESRKIRNYYGDIEKKAYWVKLLQHKTSFQVLLETFILSTRSSEIAKNNEWSLKLRNEPKISKLHVSIN